MKFLMRIGKNQQRNSGSWIELHMCEHFIDVRHGFQSCTVNGNRTPNSQGRIMNKNDFGAYIKVLASFIRGTAMCGVIKDEIHDDL